MIRDIKAEKEKKDAIAAYEKNKNELKNLILHGDEEEIDISIKVLRSVIGRILEHFNKKKKEKGNSFYGLLEINIDDFCRYFDTYEILELEKAEQWCNID